MMMKWSYQLLTMPGRVAFYSVLLAPWIRFPWSQIKDHGGNVVDACAYEAYTDFSLTIAV